MPVRLRKAAAAIALVAVGFLGGMGFANARTPNAGPVPASDVPVAQPNPDPCGGGAPSDADRSLT